MNQTHVLYYLAMFVPMIDFSSHAEVVEYLRTNIGTVSAATIDAEFYDWATHDDWLKLGRVDCVLEAVELYPDCVDLDRLIIHLLDTPGGPFDQLMGDRPVAIDVWVRKAVRLERYDLPINTSADMLKRFNAHKQRKYFGPAYGLTDHPLLRQLDDSMVEFLANRPRMLDCKSRIDATSYAQIIGRKIPALQSITNAATFAERFHEFTFGLFQKSLNPNAPKRFPWHGVVCAGGAIASLLESSSAPSASSDIDIFILKSHDTDRRLHRIVEWFASPDTYFAVRGSVVSIYICGVPRVFQIVCGDFRSMYEVLARFDFSHVQWAVDSTLMPTGTGRAVRAFYRRATKMYMRRKSSFPRSVKALSRGYDIIVCDTSRALFENGQIEDLQRFTQNVQQCLIDSQAYWHPPASASTDVAARVRTVAMIRKFEHTLLVLTDVDDVCGACIVGANFDNGYCVPSISKFDVRGVKNARGIRETFCGSIYGLGGRIELETPALTVATSTLSDSGDFSFRLIADDALKQFVENIVCGELMRLHLPEGTKYTPLLTKNGEITMQFSASKLEAAEQFQRDLLVNSDGTTNPMLTLAAGDSVQVAFTIFMQLVAGDTTAIVRLVPKRLRRFWHVARQN